MMKPYYDHYWYDTADTWWETVTDIIIDEAIFYEVAIYQMYILSAINVCRLLKLIYWYREAVTLLSYLTINTW